MVIFSYLLFSKYLSHYFAFLEKKMTLFSQVLFVLLFYSLISLKITNESQVSPQSFLPFFTSQNETGSQIVTLVSGKKDYSKLRVFFKIKKEKDGKIFKCIFSYDFSIPPKTPKETEKPITTAQVVSVDPIDLVNQISSKYGSQEFFASKDGWDYHVNLGKEIVQRNAQSKSTFFSLGSK